VEPFVYIPVSVGCLLVVVIFVVLLLRRKSLIVAVPLAQAGPFILPIPPGPPASVEVWIRYSVSFPYAKAFGAQVSRSFTLVVDLDVDGQRTSFGAGGGASDGRAPFEGLVSYFTSWSPGGDGRPSQYSASVLVKRLPARPRTVQGAVYGEGTTTLNHAELSLRG
jgi:hypothetical protein